LAKPGLSEVEDARDEELFESRGAHELPAELRDGQRRREQIEALLGDLAEARQGGRAVPKRVPVTDLEARVMPNKDGGHAPNYTQLQAAPIEVWLVAESSQR
jgi:hypothetical protein